MADFSALKTAIQANIRTNGNEEITGAILQDILLSMVTTMGDGAINALAEALDAEVTARQNAVGGEATTRAEADSQLSGRINSEAQIRGEADTQLANSITAITTRLNEGYVYAGIATPSTNPGIPAGKVFYIALQAGTYTNFSSLAVTQGITILKYNGTAWSQEQLWGVDDIPTAGSNNLVKSGGVFANIGAFDISEYHKSGSTLATYADLTAALAALPSDFQKGGMSIKFVQSSDNMYLQYRLLNDSFSANVANWQIEDVESYMYSFSGIQRTDCGLDINGNIVQSFGLGISDDVSVDGYESIIYRPGFINNDLCLLRLDANKDILGYLRANDRERVLTLDGTTKYVRYTVQLGVRNAGIFDGNNNRIGTLSVGLSETLGQCTKNLISDKELISEKSLVYKTDEYLCKYKGKKLNENGEIVNSSNVIVTDKIFVGKSDTVRVKSGTDDTVIYTVFYNYKDEIVKIVRTFFDTTIDVPVDAYYFMSSICVLYTSEGAEIGIWLSENPDFNFLYKPQKVTDVFYKKNTTDLNVGIDNHLVSADGLLVSENGFFVTDRIKTKEGDQICWIPSYYSNTNAKLACYDSDDNVITTFSPREGSKYITLCDSTGTANELSKVAYIRVSVKKSYVDTAALFINGYSVNYLYKTEDYKESLDESIVNSKEAVQRLGNLNKDVKVNTNTLKLSVTGAYLNSDGTTTAASSYGITDKIYIEPYSEITWRVGWEEAGGPNSDVKIGVFDANDNMINYKSWTEYERIFRIAQASARYIKASVRLDKCENAVFINGDTSYNFAYDSEIKKNIPTKLRMCTFNDGTFKQGTQEQYRHAIAETGADIIALQEDYMYFDSTQEGLGVDGSLPVYDTMYATYKYYYRTGSTISNFKAFLSKYPLYNLKKINYSMGYGEHLARHPYFLTADLVIDDKTIKLITLHFDWYDIDTRAQEIQEVLSYANQYEYVIIAGDFNPDNYIDGEIVDIDRYNISDVEFPIWEAAGYKIANRGYLGVFDTCYSPAISAWNPVDNIVVSPNIQIQNVSMIIKDWMTDHRPLVAELTIY